MSLTTLTLEFTALGLFLGMLMFTEIGRRVGLRSQKPDPDGKSDGAGVIEAAVFALFGLLMAFKFSAAASRLETRQQHAVQEANAIGTAWLRLDLLPPDHQPPLRDLFRRYAGARVHAYDLVPDMPAVESEIRTAQKLQNEIWSRATAACGREGASMPAILVIPALNEMIDMTTTRDTKALTHTPWPITLHSFVVALLCALLAGRAMASGRRNLFHSIMFCGVVAITYFVVLDLEYPRLGIIRIGAADQALRDVLKSMGP